ncbi:MAG: glycosyltransferase [Alphaproteobacteria bacterium]|nr:glycosyltransferase [Alphaproteobacteria bacterium]MDE2493454.1 glycosyltransferase [Alphaproteobacteria bacterium]
MDKISIIMNCAYGVQFIKEAIDSVFSQTYPDWEIVFVDNCCADGSVQIARSYEHTGRVRYVRTASRIPLYAARNVGVQSAAGRYIAFHDVDDVLEPNALERLHAKMQPDLTFVYGGYRYIDGSGTFLPRKIQGHASGNIANQLLYRPFIAIGCILLRREIFDKEQFDASYDILGDFDMWLRLSANGALCDFVDEHLTRIRVHGANMSIVKFHKWIQEERRCYRNFLAVQGLRYPMILFAVLKFEVSHLIRRRRI